VIFNKWKKYLDPSIELRPIELAGRGKRIQEPLYNDIQDVIEDVFNIIKGEINEYPYTLLGHSMGGMIAYELAQKIKKDNLPSPIHIFFSGKGAPHVKDDKKYHLMPEEEFKKEIIELGGTPPEFFDHPELMEVFLPLLKNDFKLSEAELYNGNINPLNCNITVFIGKEDDLTAEECDGWKKHTKGLCSIHYFEGKHFFILDETKQIVRLINNVILGNIYQ
jgi:surfactin synthase thioesterase subunit